jgi:hypothetical protein
MWANGYILNPDHCHNLQTLLSQYYEDILDMKGASGAVQIRKLKFRKSVEPPPPQLSPPPPPDNCSNDADAVANAEGVEAMPMAEPQPPYQLCRWGAGAASNQSVCSARVQESESPGPVLQTQKL